MCQPTYVRKSFTHKHKHQAYFHTVFEGMDDGHMGDHLVVRGSDTLCSHVHTSRCFPPHHT